MKWLYRYSPSACWWCGTSNARSRLLRALVHVPLPSFLLLNSASLVGVLVFKALTTTRYHGVAPIRSIVIDSVEVHFYELGLRLPIVVLKVILSFWNPAVFALATLAGLFAFWYLRRLARQSNLSSFGFRRAFALFACGVLVFAAGNAIFLVSKGEVGFTATGVGNRIAIAAGFGMAIIFSGTVMCLSVLAKGCCKTPYF